MSRYVVRHFIFLQYKKKFAITLKDKDLNEEELKDKLGDKFQGKIIRGKMWLYNESAPLNIAKEELIESIQ